MKIKLSLHLFGLLFIAFLLLSTSTGRSDERAGAPGDVGTCFNSSCHRGGGNGSSSLSIAGNPSSIEPSTTYSLTLTHNESNFQFNGGFQIVATDGVNNTNLGSFTASSGTKIISGTQRLVQNTPKSSTTMDGVNWTVSWTFDWTSPTSANMPASQFVFYYSINAVDGDFLADADDIPYNSSLSLAVLPVELTYFRAEAVENTILLHWQTASERNSDYFEVQRSSDLKAFDNIGRIESIGNTNEVSNYEWIDENLLQNRDLYYRLKQVDVDGTVSYSSVEVATIQSTEQVTIFPNPVGANQNLTLQWSEDGAVDRRVMLSNLQGQLIYEWNGLEANKNRIQLPTSSLSKGTYMLSIFEGERLIKTEKVVIQE